MTILPPTTLRCEYLKDPLGVDVERPRLSWVLHHTERGQNQKSYRILASSSTDLASRRIGDLWDSGRIDSAGMSGIQYGGIPLASMQACYWTVKWWDKDDRESDWSELARFEMGILREEEWKAKWISKKDCKEFRSKGTTLLGKPLGDYVNAFAIYLRREIKLLKPIKRARAFVCGLGYYELRIDGRKIGDRVLEPAQTDYDKTSYYSTYDVSDYVARADPLTGVRRIVVGIILGNGRHIRNYGYGYPKACAEVWVEYIDGTYDIVVSDAGWKVSHGPLQENGLYFGERYDARMEMSGWDEIGFDDAGWESAIVVEGVRPVSGLFPPIRVVTTLRYVNHVATLNGVHIYDFGQNFAGWVRIRLKGPAGSEIQLRHGELLNEDGSLNISTNQNAEATDVYVLSGNGVETYEPRFAYHGFRYVEVTGTPVNPTIVSILGCVVHSDVQTVGQFACSHHLLNKIHQNVLWGQRSNLMSIPTDCAQRDERQGWLGDAHLAAEESMFNFDMASFYEKFLGDIQLAQREDGSLPDTVPPYLGRLYPADPAWGAAYITIAWYLYQFYGDEAVLERHFDSMKDYISFLRANAEGFIIKTLGKYGDWCPPGSIAPKRTPVELTSTWYFYHDTLTLSRIARILNRPADQRELMTLAHDIKEAFNRGFLQEGEYAVNRFAPVDRSPGQTSNVLPLYLDMVPSDRKAQVLNRLLHSVVDEQDYHLDTGILGTRYLLDVLTDMGYADVAFKVATQETYPGWGYMVREGATTLWERWEKITGGGMNSHNHIMLGSVDAWFYRVVAGISCIEPGWAKIRFKPPVFSGLESAHASLETVRGKVSIAWQRDETHLTLDLVVPVGSVAQVFIPVLGERQTISEGNNVLWLDGAAGTGMFPWMTQVLPDGKYVRFECGSGEYRDPGGIQPLIDSEEPMNIKAKLTTFDATMIVVSLVIGIGIFRTPAMVASSTGTSFIFFSAWILGGFISFLGALTFAEIGSRFPKPGAFYKVVAECYHPSVAFMLNWTNVTIVNGAGGAAVAMIGAEYLLPIILPESMRTQAVTQCTAAGLVTLLILINYIGIKTGAWAQNILTVIKIGHDPHVGLCRFLVQRHQDPRTNSEPYQ